MLADLLRSGLTEADADAAKLRPLTADRTVALAGSHAAHVKSYRVPYFDRQGSPTEFSRFRYLQPVYRTKNGKRKLQRYTQTGDLPPALYMVPILPWQKVFEDCRTPVWITEGEKKAYAATLAGEPTVGLGGIWNYQSKKRDIELLPDLSDLAPTREIFLVFDGDGITNPAVPKARARLAARLTAKRAKVWLVDLPTGLGLDDYLLRDGIDGLRKLPRRLYDARCFVSNIRHSDLSAHEKKEQISAVVRADLAGRGRFLRTPTNQLLYFDDYARRLLQLDDSRNTELRSYVNTHYGVNASESTWSHLYEDTTSHAHENGIRAEAHNFSYFSKERKRLYVAASPVEVFRFSPSGYERVPNGTDDVFVRVPQNMAEVPRFAGSSSRSDFARLLKVSNLASGRAVSRKQLRLLLEIFVWAVIFGPSALPTRPIVLFHGDKGSGKSSGGRAIQKTLFGPSADVSTIDRARLDGLDAALVSQHLLVLDNVDGRYDGIENRLAVAATGGELSRRKLYTTMEEQRSPVRAFVVATTRQPDSFTRDDVVDRLLYMPCARRDSFLAEGEVIASIAAGRAGWWHFVCDTLPSLVNALCRSETITTSLRMADFANFAAAIARPLGHDPEEVLDALAAAEQEKVSFVAEQSPFPDALVAVVDHLTARGGELPDGFLNATALLEMVRRFTPNFPFRSPQHFGQRIRTEMDSIRQRVAIEAKYDSDSKVWTYRLGRKG